jgi:anti-sigma regulatory factor (Ser/Thr protein kinase)
VNDREGCAVCPCGHRVQSRDELRLDQRADSVAVARDRTQTLLGASGEFDPRRRDEIVLVVSELVSNAVEHAPGPYSLLLAIVEDGVCVHVRDSSRQVPHSRQPDQNGGGGYGWYVVNKLASHVGTDVTGDGKVVIAFLPWHTT